jgi:hypothetical protein
VSEIEFLKARIAEDKARVRYILNNEWEHFNMEWVTDNGGTFVNVGGENAYGVSAEDSVIANHIARYDLKRVLAECKAKERVVARHSYWLEQNVGLSQWDERVQMHEAIADGLEDAIHALASVYSDHPDYDNNWKEARS